MMPQPQQPRLAPGRSDQLDAKRQAIRGEAAADDKRGHGGNVRDRGEEGLRESLVRALLGQQRGGAQGRDGEQHVVFREALIGDRPALDFPRSVEGEIRASCSSKHGDLLHAGPCRGGLSGLTHEALLIIACYLWFSICRISSQEKK